MSIDAPYQQHSETSKSAAAAITPDTNFLRQKVYLYLLEHPDGATDERMQDDIGMLGSSNVRVALNWSSVATFNNSGQTGVTRSGRKAVIWRATVAPLGG